MALMIPLQMDTVKTTGEIMCCQESGATGAPFIAGGNTEWNSHAGEPVGRFIKKLHTQ